MTNFRCQLEGRTSGRHIFPADPAWIHKRIPTLNSPPALGPLIDAVDVYGHPAPFIRYCPAPEPDGRQEPVKKAAAKKPAKKTKKEEKREERREEKREDEKRKDEKRREEKREDEKRKDEKREEQKKIDRISTEAEKTEQQAADGTAAGKAEKAENTESPMVSESGAAQAHTVPKPPQSASHLRIIRD